MTSAHLAVHASSRFRAGQAHSYRTGCQDDHAYNCCTVVCTGELFDFDTEVEPLLEVLVGKVLEQALCEVLEEEELEAMRQHQAHFEAIR